MVGLVEYRGWRRWGGCTINWRDRRCGFDPQAMTGVELLEREG